LNDEDTGVKRDGTASDKHNAAHAAVPPPWPYRAIPVDEPIAGKPQSTSSSKISTLMTRGSGHRFVRYADDCNIFAKSQRAGQRVMQNVTRYLSETLRLTVNADKSVEMVPASRWPTGLSTNSKTPSAS
jgi:hypothetical protein